MEQWAPQAYRFALDPTPAQEAALASHCGAARYAYNYLLSRVKSVMDQRSAERSYGIEEEHLTPTMNWSAYGLRNYLNSVKDEVAPWWSENSKEAFANGAANLALALKNWNASRKGARAGKRVGFPRYKTRNSRHTMTFTTGAIRVNPDRVSVTLPRIGRVHTLESTRKLARKIENGSARITRATITHQAGRWFVVFTTHVLRRARSHSRPGTVVGVDVGVKDLLVAATPDGSEVLRVPLPAEIRELEKKRRTLQRRSRNQQAPRRGVAPSNRWRRANERITRLYGKIMNLREDAIHKATTHLSTHYETVVLENLNVAGMRTRGGAHKKGLNGAISRAALATTRHHMNYKTAREGGTLVLADRWFPSSKTCSSCSAVKAKLRLDEREYACTECGVILDRDVNAAINLAQLVVSDTPRVARGLDVEPSVRPRDPAGSRAAGREASTLDLEGPSTSNSALLASA